MFLSEKPTSWIGAGCLSKTSSVKARHTSYRLLRTYRNQPQISILIVDLCTAQDDFFVFDETRIVLENRVRCVVSSQRFGIVVVIIVLVLSVLVIGEHHAGWSPCEPRNRSHWPGATKLDVFSFSLGVGRTRGACHLKIRATGARFRKLLRRKEKERLVGIMQSYRKESNPAQPDAQSVGLDTSIISTIRIH